jgi:hypothetical protein
MSFYDSSLLRDRHLMAGPAISAHELGEGIALYHVGGAGEYLGSGYAQHRPDNLYDLFVWSWHE